MRIERGRVVLPAFATAHSHAFQRDMRGLAQRPAGSGEGDFWSWREAMYAVAGSLTPETLYASALRAYRDLAARGIRTVGEFHYVHHDTGGSPYAQRTVMSEAIITAAKDAGLRVALLRVVYSRSRPGQPAEGVQRRFCDDSLDDALVDIEHLQQQYANDPEVRIGIAPHSLRAVSPEWLVPLREFASLGGLPVHMHVAEQPGDVDSCVAETGRRPVELLEQVGLLCGRFTAVHATHLAAHEAVLLGSAGARVCLCPTTERDLGDGLPDVTALRDANVALCVGTDSHVLVDPFEDMRGVELGERLRTGKRLRGSPGPDETPARRLWRMSSEEGCLALGFEGSAGSVEIARDSSLLEGVDDEHVLDAIVFSGTLRDLIVPDP